MKGFFLLGVQIGAKYVKEIEYYLISWLVSKTKLIGWFAIRNFVVTKPVPDCS